MAAMTTTSSHAGGARRATKASSDWRWIEALRNPLAGVARVRPGCIATCDVTGDGAYQLVAACPDSKLRVIDGRSGSVQNVVKLIASTGEPSSLSVFYPDTRAARVPAIAIACGSNVYVYRNLRPFFKFALPAVAVAPPEQAAWTQALDGDIPPDSLYDTLQSLRDEEGVSLTVTSAELLALDKAPVSNLSLYIEEHRAEARELRRLSVVTCMTAIPRDSHEPRAQSQLVVGTEAGDVLVLSAAGTSVEARFALPGGAQPASINSTGLWSVDSRLVVRTREGTIRAIRNQRMTSTILRTGVPITCCVAMESAIVAATMDGRLHCWHPKGKALWNDDPPSAVVSMCKVADPHASREVVAVALADGDVRLYAGGVVLHSTGATNVEGSTDPDSGSGVTAMVFGGFGGERRCLITAHAMGSVRVRVLPRRARLESAAVDSSSPPDEQDVPMDLPKRTRLHVQNIHREQAEAPEIWRSLERDRRRLRLAVMREYVKTISSGVAPDATGTIVSVSSLFDVAPAASASSSSSASAGSSSGSAASPLRLTAEVQGVGPGFLIVLHLTSAMRITAAGAWLVVSCDEAQYTVEGSLGGSHLIVLPPLPPKMPVVVPVAVRCIDPAGAPRGQIRLTVVPPHDRLGEPGGLTAAAAAVAQGGSSAPAELVAAFSRPIASLAVDMPQSVEAEM